MKTVILPSLGGNYARAQIILPSDTAVMWKHQEFVAAVLVWMDSYTSTPMKQSTGWISKSAPILLMLLKPSRLVFQNYRALGRNRQASPEGV